MNKVINFSSTYLNKELSKFIKNRQNELFKLIFMVNELKDNGFNDIQIANIIREMNKSNS